MIKLDMIGYFRMHAYACKQKAANCMHAVNKLVILSNAFILRADCTRASHQQATATQWWHMRANCMHAILAANQKQGVCCHMLANCTYAD